MSPETGDYPRKAVESLDEAEKIAQIGLGGAAARSAYYAAFHAAEAVIFHMTGKVAKTHSGVGAELARLWPRGPGSGPPLVTFLARAYRFKELADYSIGDSAKVTAAQARGFIQFPVASIK